MRKIIVILFFIIFNECFSQSWVIQYSSSTLRFNDIQFINTLTGFAAADSGFVYRTINGGANWTRISINVTDEVHRILFGNVNTGYAVTNYNASLSGNLGKVYKTTNSGLNWFQSYASSVYAPHSISALNSDTVVVSISSYFKGGNYGGLIKSINGGSNFTTAFSQDRGLGYKTQITSRSSWFWFLRKPSPIRNIFSRSTDFGVTWNNVLINGDSSYSLTDFYFINDNTGYALLSTNVYKTTNKGINWTNLPQINYQYPSEINFINENTGWATIFSAGALGICRTTNGGLNWDYSSINHNGFITDNFKTFFIDANTGWIVGGTLAPQKGCILKTTNGGVTFTNQNPSIIPDKFALSQNYPNPFNPLTRINYELPITNYVQLKVFDNLGNEVETLVNEKQTSGSYSVDFNAASLPSGIYFYKLATENFSETKKMILIK